MAVLQSSGVNGSIPLPITAPNVMALPLADEPAERAVISSCINLFTAFLIAAIVSPPPTIEINCLDFVLFDIVNAKRLDGEDWLYVIISDHGGEGTGHGDADHPNINRTIFFVQHPELIFNPPDVFSVAEIPFIISPATLSVHFDQASTTLLYFSPLVIKPSEYCVS